MNMPKWLKRVIIVVCVMYIIYLLPFDTLPPFKADPFGWLLFVIFLKPFTVAISILFIYTLTWPIWGPITFVIESIREEVCPMCKKRRARIEIKYENYTKFYKCKYCGYEWTVTYSGGWREPRNSGNSTSSTLPPGDGGNAENMKGSRWF